MVLYSLHWTSGTLAIRLFPEPCDRRFTAGDTPLNHTGSREYIIIPPACRVAVGSVPVLSVQLLCRLLSE